MAGILDSNEVTTLLTLVEESARSTEQGVKHFVEPAPGTLQRAVTKRHHIIFGRRGSGKSSLLRKAAADLTLDRRPIAYVNLEPFKGHSYPDVLLSVLISTFKEFKRWMDSAAIHPATRTSFWQKLFGTTPRRPSFNRKQSQELSRQLGAQIETLEKELHASEGGTLKVISNREEDKTTSVGLSAKTAAHGSEIGANIGGGRAVKESHEIEEEYKRSKIDFLHRNILSYQEIFRQLASLSGGDAFLFLDDLYHIRRSDQANVVDYFHRIGKDNDLWLKVGTIRHRTRWYVHGDPPLGMKLGDDADEIDLDLTLEKYSLAKDFLERILKSFADEAGIKELSSVLTEGALERLVLASGGGRKRFSLDLPKINHERTGTWRWTSRRASRCRRCERCGWGV